VNKVNKTVLGLMAVVGSALGAWWWLERRSHGRRVHFTPARDRGTVIYDNIPSAADIDAII